MRRYIVAVRGEISVLDIEVALHETPEQRAEKLLASVGMEVLDANVIQVDDR